MRALIWLVLLFAIAAGLTVAGHYNNGYVLLVLSGWRVELSLNFFALLIFATFFALYGMARLVSRTLAMPAEVAQFRARKRRERGIAALMDATRLQIEGRHGQALKRAELAFELEAGPGLAALLAARAAAHMGDAERERLWLMRARDYDATTRSARLMTEAQLALQSRRFDEARECLELLRASGQRHITALRLALRVEQARGQWEDVLRLARQLEKYRALSAEEALPVKRRANLENLRALKGDAVALDKYWNSLPPEERRDRRIAETVARGLCAAGDHRAAQKLLETWLDNEWDSSLAELYGECEGGDARSRIARAEAWLKRQPRDARLLLALGRLCRQNELWGKAQSYLEASLSVEPLRAAHVELAQLHERLGREDEARQQFRAAALA